MILHKSKNGVWHWSTSKYQKSIAFLSGMACGIFLAVAVMLLTVIIVRTNRINVFPKRVTANNGTTVMNYREALQAQIEALQKVYDNAEGLRDAAHTTTSGNDWNVLRSTLPKIWQLLQAQDNRISDDQAQRVLRGEYHINTKS